MPLTPSGNISSKSAPGNKTWKRHLKMEKIVRLVGAGYTDLQIAAHMGITPQYVSMLKRSDEFQAKNVEVLTGVVSQYDSAMRDTVENGLEELREMVPTAMLALRDSLLDKANPKLRFEAAKEILDREGSLAKVSRSEIKVKEDFDYSHNDLVSIDLLAALQANSSKFVKPLAEGLGTSNASGQEDNDSDPAQVQSDIAEMFVRSGLSKEAQSELHKHIDLEEFEIPHGAKTQ